jgi:hypothetical protein
MLLHQVQHQLFCRVSVVLDLSWFMVSASYRRRASTLCRELRLSAFVQSMSAVIGEVESSFKSLKFLRRSRGGSTDRSFCVVTPGTDRRTLGCTKEQISRHLDQLAKSRTQPAEQMPTKHRDHRLEWP